MAITIADIKNRAYIADEVMLNDVQDVDMISDLFNEIDTDGAAGAEGGVSAVPVFALTLLFSTAAAQVGGDANPVNPIQVGGNVNVVATHTNRVSTRASGKAAGKKVGVGASVALTIVVDRTIATTSRKINAGGSVSFKAKGVSQSSSTAEAGANGGEEEEEEEEDGDGDPETGGIDELLIKYLGLLNNLQKVQNNIDGKTVPKAETSEGKVNVAGAVAVNVVDSITEAFIPDNGKINAGGRVTLEASNNVDSQAVADSSAVDSEIGVGVAVAINAATVFNQAYIGKNAKSLPEN